MSKETTSQYQQAFGLALLALAAAVIGLVAWGWILGRCAAVSRLERERDAAVAALAAEKAKHERFWNGADDYNPGSLVTYPVERNP